jgi:hypothetical protein
MARWRVVCVKRRTVNHSHPHVHIVGVGTGDRADWADMRWTLEQVIMAMDEGDTFYTQGEPTAHISPVEKAPCPLCDRPCIRYQEGHMTDSSLDDMRECIYD